MSSDGPAVRRCVTELLAGAKHTVNIMMPGTYDRAKHFMPLLGRVTAVADSGVTVRMLCAPRVLAPLGLLAAAHRAPLGYEVRITDVDLQGTVIVDGRASFGRSGPERGGCYATLNTDPASARALDLMFAGAWSGAVPMQEHLRLADRLRSDSVRMILERLREGRPTTWRPNRSRSRCAPIAAMSRRSCVMWRQLPLPGGCARRRAGTAVRSPLTAACEETSRGEYGGRRGTFWCG
ncbi:hypothetical protein NKH77_24180 [Streptomyces sp. M19]